MKTFFAENPDGSFDYADADITEWRDSPLWWHTQGRQQTASGYGSKLVTSKMVLIGKRWHRVYCICYSNVGTCYIIQNGARRIVRG